MIILETQTEVKADLKLLEEILTALKVTKDIELLLVENSVIEDLNREYRGKDAPTDVLSFPLQDIKGAPLGSIVISTDKAKELSQKLGHRVNDEIALLFTHGLLHLLGYDHECDSGEMRRLEKELIEKFNLPDSLIVRSEGI
ncbi:MAG TPA: rRNA maturation RNase YbeY [Nitratifractor sp.]|nr:rRNA maturation RNase YbeY [Nitratifractor sp.]